MDIMKLEQENSKLKDRINKLTRQDHMSKENRYCKLTTEYNKKFKSKVTILKICDKLMEDYKQRGGTESKDVCRFCGNRLI